MKKFHFRKQPETLKTCAFVRQGKLIPLLFNALHKINTQLFSPCISISEFDENAKGQLQLNKYETAPKFNHISQNLTSDFLLI